MSQITSTLYIHNVYGNSWFKHSILNEKCWYAANSEVYMYVYSSSCDLSVSQPEQLDLHSHVRMKVQPPSYSRSSNTKIHLHSHLKLLLTCYIRWLQVFSCKFIDHIYPLTFRIINACNIMCPLPSSERMVGEEHVSCSESYGG